MTRKRKTVIAVIILLLIAAVVAVSVTQSRQDATTVQAEKVQRRDLLEAKVTANGEIKPLDFQNLTSEVAGRIMKIYVREGDVVKKGQELLKLDPIQIEADLAQSLASLRAAQADRENSEAQFRAAENNVLNTEASLEAARFDLERVKADLTLADQEYKRAQRLIEEGIVPKSQFDAAEARYKAAQAVVRSQQSRVEQLQSQLKDTKIRVEVAKTAIESSAARIAQAEASLTGSQDRANKTVQKAPIDGVVANLQVREGQFALASFQTTPLMSIADMSQINVEVQVDETDITNVRQGLQAKIKVDALGDEQLDGIVTQVAQATTTASATAALTGSTQEAKDFKVVINLVNLKDEVRNRLRPGMSATATITTDTREKVVAIPVQALVEREVPSKSTNSGETKASASDKKVIQGVFVVNGNKARFRPVETGITGETDIEIVSGLKEGEEIIVGPYQELRKLKDDTVIKKEQSLVNR